MADDDRQQRGRAIGDVIRRFLDDKAFRGNIRRSNNPAQTLEDELQRQYGIRFTKDERAFLNVIDWSKRPRDIRAAFQFSRYAFFW